MGSFYHGTDQETVRAAFADDAADLDRAADLILGRRELTEAQRWALSRCSGNAGYRLTFVPSAVGHLAFRAVATRGCGNAGWVILIPATPACRALVRRSRQERLIQALQRAGMPPVAAARVATAIGGWAKGGDLAISMAKAFVACPDISDRGLRELGWRPGHPHEGAVIDAFRRALQ